MKPSNLTPLAITIIVQLTTLTNNKSFQGFQIFTLSLNKFIKNKNRLLLLKSILITLLILVNTKSKKK